MSDIIDVAFNVQSAPLGIEIQSMSLLFKHDRTGNLEAPSRVNFYQVLLFTKGQGQHYIDFNIHEYRPGTLLFIAPGQVARFKIKRQNEADLVLFTEEFVQGGLADGEPVDQLRIFDHCVYSPKMQLNLQDYDGFRSLIQLLGEEAQRPDDFAQTEIMRSLLRALLFRGERLRRLKWPGEEATHYYQRFLSFKKLLEREYHRCHNAQDYAQVLGLSIRGLNNLTQRVSNRTAKALIDQRLVLEAKRLLSNSDCSVKELSYRLGFDEPTNFVKYFKRHTNQTPLEFRHSCL